MRTLRHPSRLLITFAIAACASSGVGDGESGPRREANLITTEELTQVLDRSIYEAIQILRPQWLRRTGFRNDLPSAVTDNQLFELTFLETMPSEMAESLRFITPTDATFRWGTGYPSGAIEVSTRQR